MELPDPGRGLKSLEVAQNDEINPLALRRKRARQETLCCLMPIGRGLCAAGVKIFFSLVRSLVSPYLVGTGTQVWIATCRSTVQLSV